MIIINSLNDLEKYKANETYNKKYDFLEKTYIFQNDSQLLDVEFNINLNFSFEEQEEQFETSLNTELFMYCFIANNVKFNKGCRIHKLIAKNLNSNITCDIDDLEIENNINTNCLSCQSVIAKDIISNSVIVGNTISCHYIKTKKFLFNDLEFINLECQIKNKF